MRLKLFPVESCSGVYLLICRKTKKKYVGASYNVKKRTEHHIRNKFETCDAFLLEKVSRESLPAAEARWIKKLSPELNVRLNQTGGAGLRRANTSKFSAWQKGVKRGPHNHGAAISKALKGKQKSKKHIKNATIARKKVGNGPWSELRWERHFAKGKKRRKL